MIATARTRRLRLGGTAAALALGIFAAVAPAQAADPRSLRAVLDAHLCDLSERLARIQRTPRDRTGRYIVVSAEDRRDAYVQCRFVEKDARMLCEAASGHYTARGASRPVHPGDRGALDALGFAARPDGNDMREVAIAGPEDLGEVAQLMLRALHDGYGFRVPTPLLVKAPFARLPAPASSGCIPVS